MKIATWNVNGIRARQAQVCELLERDRPDVVCLQELKAEAAQIPVECAREDYHVYWHGLRAYSGVSLHIRKGLLDAEPVFSHPDFDMESRIVQATLGKLVLASVYVPNGGKDYEAKLRFLDALGVWTGECCASAQPLILCGDLNVALEERDVHPKLRKANQIGTRDEERALLVRLMERGLHDIGRALDPANDNLFTWWAPWRNLRQRNIGWRIDYVLASQPFVSTASSAVSMREFGTSDHAPVVVEWADPGCDEIVAGAV